MKELVVEEERGGESKVQQRSAMGANDVMDVIIRKAFTSRIE